MKYYFRYFIEKYDIYQVFRSMVKLFCSEFVNFREIFDERLKIRLECSKLESGF